MSKKRKDKLLLNIKETERYKHRVAMVNEESGWNQHEPNSGMARMFVIMLLIHVVVIGGIIIYDFMHEDAPHSTMATRDYAPANHSALPPSGVSNDTLEKQNPIEEYATYEWRSGDSLPSVAQKLEVSEEVLIRLNMLDKGAQIDQHTILRYPRRPVVKALALGVAGAHGATPKAGAGSPVVAHAKAKAEKAEKTESAMSLTPPGEAFSFEPTIMERLTPAPTIAPGQPIQDSPPATKPTKSELPTASNIAAKSSPAPATKPVKSESPAVSSIAAKSSPAPAPVPAKPAEPTVAKVQEKTPEKLPDVPKAVPVPRPVMLSSSQSDKSERTERSERVEKTEKKPEHKVADSPPSTKSETATKSSHGSYVVKPGETLYRIAAKNGVTVAALQKANHITKPESLRDGMKLVIPAK